MVIGSKATKMISVNFAERSLWAHHMFHVVLHVSSLGVGEFHSISIIYDSLRSKSVHIVILVGLVDIEIRDEHCCCPKSSGNEVGYNLLSSSSL